MQHHVRLTGDRHDLTGEQQDECDDGEARGEGMAPVPGERYHDSYDEEDDEYRARRCGRDNRQQLLHGIRLG